LSKGLPPTAATPSPYALLKLTKATQDCAVHLKYLGVGDAASTMGAVEFLAIRVNEGLSSVAEALAMLKAGVRASGHRPGEPDSELASDPQD
jgi:hypothetical protein